MLVKPTSLWYFVMIAQTDHYTTLPWEAVGRNNQ